MSNKLKHPYVYVYELNKIIAPAKARAALVSHMNPYNKFHFFCKYCGVKLSGKCMGKPKIRVRSKQPHCSDWIEHKSFCEKLRKEVGGEKKGGGNKIPPPPDHPEIYIPTHLIYTPPYFAFQKIEDIKSIDLLNEVPLNTLENATDEELSDDEYEIFTTYWLKEVVDAYEWLIEQNLKENQWPKIKMGDSSFYNSYQYLFKKIEQSHFYIGQNKVFFGKIKAQYVTFKTEQEYYSLFSEQSIWISSIKKYAYLHIKVPKKTCQNTILEDILEDLIKHKKQKFIYDYYITNHSLDIEPIEIIKNQHSRFQCELVINNPFLFVLMCSSSTEE